MPTLETIGKLIGLALFLLLAATLATGMIYLIVHGWQVIGR